MFINISTNKNKSNSQNEGKNFNLKLNLNSIYTYLKNTCRALAFSLIAVSLVGCAVYNSSFGCPDAKGLNCRPVSLVDRQISSGEIEEVEFGNYRGKSCKTRQAQTAKPNVGLGRIYKAQVTPDSEIDLNEPVITEEAIYVK
jgi:hypothetical protein